jgi:hypothetical protein
MANIIRKWSPVTYSDRQGYSGFNYDDDCKAMEFTMTVSEFVEACGALYALGRTDAEGLAHRSFGDDEPYGVAVLGINEETGDHEIYIDLGGCEGYGIIGIGPSQCEIVEKYIEGNKWKALGELGEILKW